MNKLKHKTACMKTGDIGGLKWPTESLVQLAGFCLCAFECALKDDELLGTFLDVSVKSNVALKAIKIFIMNQAMMHKNMKALKNCCDSECSMRAQK